MRRAIFAMIVLVAGTLTLAIVPAGDAANPLLPPTTVELAIRGPNGRTVADTDVLLFSSDEHVAAKTDATGLARFAWPYPAPIFVRVPRVGYGATGLFPLRAGKTVRVPLPRLAPFGVVDGAVPESLAKPGMVVGNGGVDWAPQPGWTMHLGNSEWLRTETAVDDDGHFVLKDVPAGDCWIHADLKHGELPIAETDIFVDPGEVFKNIVLAKSPPRTAIARPDSKEQKADEPKPEAPPPEKEPEPVAWAEGTVRDEAGRPLEGAQVFATVLERGAYVEFASAALTDVHGHWQVVGAPWHSVTQGELLVCKFGYCHAVVPMRIPKPPDDDAVDARMPDRKPQRALPLKPQVFDVALSDHCGGMEVLVTRDGKPLADAMVSISEAASEELVLWAASESVAGEEAAQRILHPISVTGEDGIARFNELTPGKYAILVDEHLPDPRFVWQSWERGPDGTALWDVPAYHGAIVEYGKVRRFHALVPAADYRVPLRVMNPDGKPAAGLTTGWWVGRRENETCSSNGLVVNHYDRPGLKEIACTYIEDKSVIAAYGKTEYFTQYREIKSTAAASERLSPDATVAITSIASEELPGSLAVQLLDSAGRPVVGIVNAGQQTANTDETGQVRFDGVPPTVGISAIVPGMKLPQFNQWTPPLPKDKELLGHWQFGDQIKCPLGVETRFVLRPDPVGYVRGVVHPAAGIDIESYFVENYSVPKSGEFLLGPFPVGKRNLTLTFSSSHTHCEERDHKEVEIRSDRVAHIDFDQTKSPPGLPGQTKPCGGTDPGPDVDVEAAVFLPDGSTPAWRRSWRCSCRIASEPCSKARPTIEGAVPSWLRRRNSLRFRRTSKRSAVRYPTNRHSSRGFLDGLGRQSHWRHLLTTKENCGSCCRRRLRSAGRSRSAEKSLPTSAANCA